MKSFLIAIALACAAAAPAFAQLHESGIARSGTVARTQTGGTAFMCRLACSLDGGCAGWNWTRAGEDGPQSRCDILSGSVSSAPDSCCASGVANGGVAMTSFAPMSAGNQYAGRSQTPNGPPVELVGDVPAGLLTEDLQLQELAEEEAEAEEAEENGEDADFAEDEEIEEGPQASTLAQEDVPMPSARVTSVGRSGAGGRPRYSVQQEYGGTATVPEQAPPPTGVANPNRWLGG